MIEVFSDYNGLEIFFLICAILGSIFVVFKFILQFMGGDADLDGADGIDGADGFDGDFDGDHADSDLGFRLLSIHGLSSFFMMFGLVGLAMYRGSQFGVTLSMIGAVIAGSFSVWIIGYIFKLASRLQSSGTLSTNESVGCTGKVYLSILENGTGQVTLNFKGRLREFEAVEKDGKAVATDTPVKVVAVRANLLVVEVLQ